MSGLDVEIRVKFPVATTAGPDLATAYNALRDTLLAVLELHGAFDNPQQPVPWCSGCDDWHDSCSTREVIAKGLGIEA